MKIAILTLPLHTNYGGILQAYALQTILERMGHDVCLIERRRNTSLPIWRAPVVYGKRMLKNLLGKPYPIFYEHQIPIERQHTNRFINSHIKRNLYDDFSQIGQNDFETIVVGSDQVWRPKYFGEKDIANAYLNFTKGWQIRRIAYAASFGTDEWEYSPEQTSLCGTLLRQFDAVSTREWSGTVLCREKFGVDAVHVLDPTMLLTAEDYTQLFISAQIPKSPGSLLVYMLDETKDKVDLVRRVAEEQSLTPFYVSSKVEDKTAPIFERIQPPVEQWLRGFYDAKFVLTDSFHACVFAIIFHKPFLVVGNASRGMSRFNSLLSLFELQSRLIEPTSYSGSGHIDFKSITDRLMQLRAASMRFLEESINQ